MPWGGTMRFIDESNLRLRVSPFEDIGRLCVRFCAIASVFSIFSLAEAVAQSSTNVAAQAVDAFGEKVGSEQIGLYSEQQVRGFSLQDSGNYRLDRSYFIRSANIVGASLDGTTIRVGINALGIDFPAPSGIVEYRLAEAAPGAREEVEFALRDYGGKALFLRGSAATQDGEFGAAYGRSGAPPAPLRVRSDLEAERQISNARSVLRRPFF